jgi:uncharacterized protein (TIGR03437 family)
MSRRIAGLAFAVLYLPVVLLAQPAITSILNGASFEPTVTRGSILSLFGSNLAQATESAKRLPLPTNLAGTTVTVGDLELEAPLYFVSPGQINFQLPFEALGGILQVVVTTPQGRSKPVVLTVAPTAPGIFTRTGDGKGKALALGPDMQPLDAATPGSTMILYATGLGPTDPPSFSGSPGPGAEPFNRVVNLPDVIVGEFPARVDFAGMAPGLPGVYQLNVVPQQIGTDRLVIRSQGTLSNTTSVGVRSNSQNVVNATGTIDAIYPTPTALTAGFSAVMLAVKFTAKMDILPAAGPFMVAAVSDAATSLISVDPVSGTFDATVTVPTQASRVGDFSMAEFRIYDLLTCHVENGAVVCFPFPGNILPASRIPPDLLTALAQVPLPNTPANHSATAALKVSGTARRGSTFVIDGQNNSSVSAFAGYLLLPIPGSFTPGSGLATRTTTLKLFIDGQLVASKDVTFPVLPGIGGGPQ